MTYKQWQKRLKYITSLEDSGQAPAAVKAIRALNKQVEQVAPAALGHGQLALGRQILAGILERSGKRQAATMAYLEAARDAHGVLWSGVGLVTNSLWAAAECAPFPASASARRARIRKAAALEDYGSRLQSILGDYLNDRLLEVGMAGIVFGGRYPARAMGLPGAATRGPKRPRFKYGRASKRRGGRRTSA